MFDFGHETVKMGRVIAVYAMHRLLWGAVERACKRLNAECEVI